MVRRMVPTQVGYSDSSIAIYSIWSGANIQNKKTPLLFLGLP